MTHSTQSSSTLVAIRRDECFFPISGHSISLSSLLSYFIDWLFYISLTTVALVYAKIVPPIFAEFYLFETSLWYDHIPTDLTIVPTFLLIIYSVLIPIGQFALTIGFTTSHRWHRRLWDLHAILLTMMAAHALQTVIVSLLKNLVGAPRPDMLARCRPMSWTRPPVGRLSNVGICTQTDIGHLQEGFRSFPSAHSATAFTSAMVQVLFWIARTRMLDRSGWSWKLLLSLVPLLSASAIAFSRISDNRHHVFDVVIGMIIGLIAGYLAFIHYFPFPTFDNVCTGGRAYSPRCGILGSVGCWSLGDEVSCLRTKLFKTPKCNLKATFTMGCGTELCVCKKLSCSICSTGIGSKCSMRCSIRNCNGDACTSRPQVDDLEEATKHTQGDHLRPAVFLHVQPLAPVNAMTLAALTAPLQRLRGPMANRRTDVPTQCAPLRAALELAYGESPAEPDAPLLAVLWPIVLVFHV